MNLIDYFKMRAFLNTQEENNIITLRVAELEEIWNCSIKSVKRRIKLLVDDGRIEYTAGVGRGNVSTIIFKNEFREEIGTFVEKCIKDENLDDIIQLLYLSIPQSWISNVSKNLNILFGQKYNTKHKERIRIVTSKEIVTIDPIFASIVQEVVFLKKLGDTLTNYDNVSDSVKPHIAHNWTSNGDHTQWTFYLRKNIYFHNQDQLTAEDVKYTFERFQIEDSSYSWLVDQIDNIECIADFIIKFNLTKSNPYFFRYISLENLVILPKNEVFNENRWIGSGPFLLKKRTENKIVLSTNSNYFLEAPIIDEIEIYSIPQFEDNSILYEINNSNQRSDLKESTFVSSGVDFLCFNFKRETIVQNPYFREAIFHILDISKMIMEMDKGQIVESSCFQAERREKQNKNSGKINYLLNKSGYRNEILNIFIPRTSNKIKWIINELKKWGLEIKVYKYDCKDFYGFKFESKADLILMGDTPSSDYFLSFISMFKNKSAFGSRFFLKEHLEKIDSYLNQIEYGGIKEDIDCTIKNVEDYIKENNLLIFTFHIIKKEQISPLIRSLQCDSYDYINFNKLWIE